MSCEQVKALISIGCCYNLLSEECHEDTNTCPGFPMSKAAKLSNLVLGKSTRDLGCQVLWHLLIFLFRHSILVVDLI